jgi:hypothetical protein
MFAAAARRAVEELHTEWDSPHNFQTLHWDGEKLHCRTYACIMLDVNPPDYPAYMVGLARTQHEKDPGDPAYAYLLQIECFGVTEPGPDATKADRERYNAARLGRTFHKLPEATEACTAWVADIHGRLWAATKTRDKPGEIQEKFYPAGKVTVGGHLIDGLIAVAQATGISYHGLPGPFSGRAN